MNSSGGSGRLFFAAWCLVLMTIGLVLALFWQFLDVYFTLGPDPPTPTASDGTRWAWTASACVTAGLIAALVAIGSRSTGMRWTSAITLVIAVVASVVFIVPQNRWHHAPRPNELPTSYTPCYSGSNTCN